MNNDGPMSVKDALALPSLRAGAPHVAAGGDALDRPIRWAHSGVVDNFPVLHGGELLLTNGIGLARTAAEQRRFIRNLADHEVAGLVIELGKVFPRLPDGLRDAATRAQLPLIELNREVAFVAVTEEINSQIVGAQLAIARRGEDLHRQFTQLLLDGAGTSEILKALSTAVANPVVLWKSGEGVLYHASYRTPADEVLARFDVLNNTMPREADGPEVIRRGVPAASSREWGSLAVVAVDSALDGFAVVALERAVPLVALELLRGREEAKLGSEQRGNFLDDVAHGRVSESDGLVRARALGFDYRGGPLLPLAAVGLTSGLAAAAGNPEGAWAPVWSSIRAEFDGSKTAAIIGTHGSGGRASMVLGLRDAADRTNAIERVVRLLENFSQCVPAIERPPVVVAGPVLASWADLGPSLRLLADIAPSAWWDQSRRWYDATRPDLLFVLWQLRDDPRLHDYTKRVLDPIVEHDERHAHTLLPTLEALSEAGWNITRASENLYLHRRSLYPRLTRIERLLNCDLGDVEVRLALDCALRMRRIIAR